MSVSLAIFEKGTKRKTLDSEVRIHFRLVVLGLKPCLDVGIAVCIPCWGESVVIVGIGLLVSSGQQGVSNIAQVWPVLESAQQAARRA